MGLIKALTSSVRSTLGDEFKEYVTCPEMGRDVLLVRGEVHHGEGNKNYTEGILSNGTAIMVPESTAMMVVENGKILDFCAESGTYTFDKGSEPSIFAGSFGKSLVDSLKEMGKRTAFGGQTAMDQRVYYVNLLALPGNKFGSPQPKKITDDKYGMLEVTFFGEYIVKVDDPTILVANMLGSNAKDRVLFSEILEGQFKMKFVERLTQAITTVMRKDKVPFGDIGMYGTDISNEMNKLLEDDLKNIYGLVITDVSIGDINLTDESMARVSRIDDAQIFSNPAMQSGMLASSAGRAMENASSNANGAMMGFAGFNMASNAGASVLGAVNATRGEEANGEAMKEEPHDEVKETVSEPVQNVEGFNFCPNCGTKATGANFCSNCGHKLK